MKEDLTNSFNMSDRKIKECVEKYTRDYQKASTLENKILKEVFEECRHLSLDKTGRKEIEGFLSFVVAMYTSAGLNYVVNEIRNRLREDRMYEKKE